MAVEMAVGFWQDTNAHKRGWTSEDEACDWVQKGPSCFSAAPPEPTGMQPLSQLVAGPHRCRQVYGLYGAGVSITPPL
ncbi:unnamed protein product [Gadus morhua 'NCC']